MMASRTNSLHSAYSSKRLPLSVSSIMSDGKKIAKCTEEKMFQQVYRSLGLCIFSPASEMNAETFLINLLRHRGYDVKLNPAMSSTYSRPILQSETDLYSKELLRAISVNNFPKLVDIYQKRKHLLASNRYGESTLHLAAQKSNHRVVRFILETEENPIIMDDYGRSPLTDAMWAVSPSFVVIEQLVTKYPDLLFLTDVRGHTPLNYLQPEHVFRVCLFLYSKRNVFWPTEQSPPVAGELRSAKQTIKKEVDGQVLGATEERKRKREYEETEPTSSRLIRPPPIIIDCGQPVKRRGGVRCGGISSPPSTSSPSSGSPHRPVMISLAQGANGLRETCLLPG